MQAIAQSPNGLYVQMPVLSTGSPPVSHSNCGKGAKLRGSFPVAGFVEVNITSATQGPPKAIMMSVDCSRTGSAAPGGGTGGFFGYKSTNVYLVQ
jgi:hypothetical protein